MDRTQILMDLRAIQRDKEREESIKEIEIKEASSNI